MKALRLIGCIATVLVLLALLAGAWSLSWMCEQRSDRDNSGATFVGGVVTSLRADGGAARAGLRVGDVIEAADDGSPPDMERATTLRVRRGTREIELRMR